MSFNSAQLTGKSVRANSYRYWLLAVDFEDAAEPKKILEPVEVHFSSLLFVRHTRDYLYFGTHDGSSYTHSHNEWVVKGIALRSDKPFPVERRHQLEGQSTDGRECKPIQLKNFAGHDIGRQVAFQIHDGWFYAVTNCTSFELVEVDWTSFYHCIRFRVDDPVLSEENNKYHIYRRQHEDGVLDDRWTDISLQVDEQTNGLVIIEARNEHLKGKNGHSRTWYITPIDWDAPTVPILPGPDGDLYLPIRDCNSKYTPSQKRMPWQFHPETSHPPYRPSNFILTNTKFRKYNFNAQTFVDLVVDDNCCKGGTGGPCIRLRTGYRRIMPSVPLRSNRPVTATENKGKAKLTLESPDAESPNEPIDNNYRYSKVLMWPPPLNARENTTAAHDIMNNFNDHYGVGMPRSVSGDESFVCFLVKERGAQPDWEGKLVVICYDADAWIKTIDGLSFGSRPPKRKRDATMEESEIADNDGRHKRTREREEGVRHRPEVVDSSDYEKDWEDSSGAAAEEVASSQSPLLYAEMEEGSGSLPPHYLKNNDDEDVVDAEKVELEDVWDE